jgi:hypothetical protein
MGAASQKNQSPSLYSRRVKKAIQQHCLCFASFLNEARKYLSQPVLEIVALFRRTI